MLGPVKTTTSSTHWLAFSVAAFLTVLGAAQKADAAEAPQTGVALAIVYDTSGSMLQKVRDADGQMTPKHVIAERALNAVLDRLQAVASGSTATRLPLETGLVVFQGSRDKKQRRAGFAVPLGAFDAKAIRSWLAEHGKPQAGTPLGEAVELAGKSVLKSKLPRKHVLVITDGVNTLGPDPVQTLPKVQELAAKNQTPTSFHFVAFDVNATEFAGVKKLGATVVGAVDEKQLNSQLEFILEKKILLEDEELPSKPKTN
jgi:hypothetical protein